MPWEKIEWTVPNTTSNLPLHRYAHLMFERKGYGRVDKPKEGMYYCVDGNDYTWYEWKPYGGTFTKFRLGFWELYQHAIEDDMAREVWADAI